MRFGPDAASCCPLLSGPTNFPTSPPLGVPLPARAAEEVILHYMLEANRPYSGQNVFDNLHGAVPKAMVRTAGGGCAASRRLNHLTARTAAAPSPRCSRAQVPRILDKLSSAGGDDAPPPLVAKAFGKANVYWANQAALGGAVEPAQLDELRVEEKARRGRSWWAR